MTLEEKRVEVANRMASSREYDGENCTSVRQEFFELVYHGGRGVCEWDEPELDEYLATHTKEGILRYEDDEDDEDGDEDVE